jgi:hypothetical protein
LGLSLLDWSSARTPEAQPKHHFMDIELRQKVRRKQRRGLVSG